MGCIREPKNVDLLVGPSVFTEATKQIIAQAIAQYKETGQKPDTVQITSSNPVNGVTHISRAKVPNVQSKPVSKKRAKI